MAESCKHCGLGFKTLQVALSAAINPAHPLHNAPIIAAMEHHLKNCPPIVTEEGMERLMEHILGHRDPRIKAGLVEGGGHGGEADESQGNAGDGDG